MTARDRLVGARRMLTTVLVLRALLIGASIAAAGWALAHALSRPALVVAAAALAVGTSVMQARRAIAARSLERVALWIEERNPSLRYALVTAASAPVDPDVERLALHVPWWKDARERATRTLLAPCLAALAAAALVVWHPTLGDTTARTGTASRVSAPEKAGAADPLAVVRVVITPPRYSRRAATSLVDPTSVEALVGSTLAVHGSGDGAFLNALLDSAPRAIATRGGRWTLALVMPARPALLRLRARSGRERLLVLAPVVDAPPAVTLLLPVRDTVVRAATGSIVLRAVLHDDVGLRDAAFEIIVSTGQEENFTFRAATLARTELEGLGDRTLEVRLPLDSLALKPGDVLQMRAVARDANDVTGSGLGSSETRALRVARAGEYDSVAVDGAPSTDPEGPVLSQRMLITLAETLERRRPRLVRAELLAESGRIADDQRRLRKRVGDVVFQRTGAEPLSEEGDAAGRGGKLAPDELLKRASEATGGSAGAVMDVEGDETPILAVNKPLLEAFNAMWDAGRALEQGDLRGALPPMRRALAAIERARRAERIYLRGRPSAVVVDVARARLVGKEKGVSTTREARPPADSTMRRRSESFERATTLLQRDPAAAADTLLVLRVDALGDAPQLAAALDDASEAARRGDAARIALSWARLRRALGGAPVRRDGLPLWDGAP